MKKVVNSVLASALALTVAPMAFAADATTTEAPKMDAAMEKTVKRLRSMSPLFAESTAKITMI